MPVRYTETRIFASTVAEEKIGDWPMFLKLNMKSSCL